MRILLLLISFNCFAQKVHVHELDEGLRVPPVQGAQIHQHRPSLLKAQLEFQQKVFTRAQVAEKLSALNFEQKEDLLEVLEEEGEATFLKAYPQLGSQDYQRLKQALYE